MISDDIIPFFDKDKIKKKHCYSNVFNINVEIFSRYKVSNCNNSYVLCYVDGEPHCILKYNGEEYVVPPMLTVKGEIICSECIRP